MENMMSKRFICPCCVYPTLNERRLMRFVDCVIGKTMDNDSNKDVVRGGPNADYSLTEARDNFKKYLVIYSPSRDMIINGGDTEEEIELKKRLINVYECISKEKHTMELHKLYTLAYDIEDNLTVQKKEVIIEN